VWGIRVPHNLHQLSPDQFCDRTNPEILKLHLSSTVLGKRRTSHTKEAHHRYLMSRGLISRLAGQEKTSQQLLLVGLDLSSIWEKARARDGQREVAERKGQWGFVLQGMRPAAA
jgi:hypothetical protein